MSVTKSAKNLDQNTWFPPPQRPADQGGQILISVQLSVTFPGQPEEPHRVVTVHRVYNSSMVDHISTPEIPRPPKLPQPVTAPDIRKGMRIFSPVSGWMIACNNSIFFQ